MPADWLPETVWTQIRAAQERGGESLDALLKKYRAPVYDYLCRKGYPPQDADDLTQEAFLRIVQHDVVSKAERAAGRFRGLLLSVVRHTLQNCRRDASRLKRGSRLRRRAPDAESPGNAEEIFGTASEPDPHFDELWMRNLIRLGRERLERECARSTRPYHRALALHLDEGMSYADIAQRLRIELHDVKNHVHQARQLLKSYVAQELRLISSSSQEYENERELMERFLA